MEDAIYKSTDATSYYEMGTTYLKKGEYDQSIFYFNKALEIDPKDADAYCNRGSLYGKKKLYDRAIYDFDKTIEIDPGYALAYYNRGQLYCLKGKYDKSWNDINKAKELGYRIPPEFLDQLRRASETKKQRTMLKKPVNPSVTF